jgi:Putative metallopeptidase
MLLNLDKIVNILSATFVQSVVISSLHIFYSPKKAQSFPIDNNKNKPAQLQNKQTSNVGKFKLVYDSNTKYKSLEKVFQESGLFNKVVNDLNNQNLNLPVDVPIIFGDCGEPNAFYSPPKKEIKMCYELFTEIVKTLSPVYSSEEDVVTNSIFTGIFVLYHEVGHGLSDILQLAITGREEDAVDEFASILLLRNNNSEADKIVLNASIFFNSTSSSSQGVHSFGEQRFYNIVCLLYGRDPQKYANIPEKVNLGDRTSRCPDEYKQKLSSWQRLLAPHSINDTGNPPVESGNVIKW